MSNAISRPVGTEPKIHPDYYYDEKASTKLYARNGSSLSSSVCLLNFTGEMLKQQYDDYKDLQANKLSRNEYILRSKFRETNRKLVPTDITKEMLKHYSDS